MFRLTGLAALSLLGLLAFANRAEPQCAGPDQLDGGPCCTQAQPILPKFPNFTQPSLEICWQNCNVAGLINYRAVWKNVTIAPPTGIPCGERLMTLDLIDTAGVLTWTGTQRLQYSRTWIETDPGGLPIQVWRFLVNGDMSPATSLATIPCPVPSCVPVNNNRARFSGYIDFAANCAVAPTLYQKAWMLTHACDAIDHAPGFPRAGVFHPDRSYTFVGPSAGFVPGPIQPIEGTAGSVFEAMRRRNFPPLGTTGPVTCDFEERLINHTLTTNAQFCFCGPAGAPAQFHVATLGIAGACGTTVTTPGGPVLPGFVSMGIGTWTIPGTFPGVEVVRWNAGVYDDVNPCAGFVRRGAYFGVTTLGGFPARQLLVTGPAGPLPPTFIDQSSSLRPGLGLAPVMNIPFVSDHFLNLNH